MKTQWFRIAVAVLMCLAVAATLYAASHFRTESVASYVTTVEGRSPEQINNIRLAAQRLDGVVIQPGETLSFLRQIGRTDASRGYAKAPIYSVDSTEEAEAGGICQVSSTLYNTALLAGLDVEERWPHSRPVASVPPGLDATVATGIADLKIKNSAQTPLTIRASTSAGLKISIVGMGRIPDVRITRKQTQSGNSLHVRVYRQTASSRQLVSADSYRSR